MSTDFDREGRANSLEFHIDGIAYKGRICNKI